MNLLPLIFFGQRRGRQITLFPRVGYPFQPFFFWTGSELFTKFFSQTSLSVCTYELVLLRHALSSVAFAAADTAFL